MQQQGVSVNTSPVKSHASEELMDTSEDRSCVEEEVRHPRLLLLLLMIRKHFTQIVDNHMVHSSHLALLYYGVQTNHARPPLGRQYFCSSILFILKRSQQEHLESIKGWRSVRRAIVQCDICIEIEAFLLRLLLPRPEDTCLYPKNHHKCLSTLVLLNLLQSPRSFQRGGTTAASTGSLGSFLGLLPVN